MKIGSKAKTRAVGTLLILLLNVFFFSSGYFKGRTHLPGPILKNNLSASTAVRLEGSTRPRVYSCGWLPQSVNYANALFPDYDPRPFITAKLAKNLVARHPENIYSTNVDVMVATQHECVSYWRARFKGKILYLDAENGKRGSSTAGMIPGVYYTGPWPDHPKSPGSTPKPTAGNLRVYLAVLDLLNFPNPLQNGDHMIAGDTELSGCTGNDLATLDRTSSVPFATKHFLIYITSNCVGFRESTFDLLTKNALAEGLGRPRAAGRCHGLFPEASIYQNDREDRFEVTIETMKHYKFSLVMENEVLSGYITEKIIQGFLASTIPIYYGTTEIFDLFNRDAFVFWDIAQTGGGGALDVIIDLAKDEIKYMDMLRKPVLKHPQQETLKRYFSVRGDVGGGKLKENIRTMMGITEHYAGDASG